MNSVISSRYNYNNGQPLIRLNFLQQTMKKQVESKIAGGSYSFEEEICPCGSTSVDTVAERDRFGFAVRNVICRDCGLIRLNPRFTQRSYEEFYNHEYRRLYTGKDTVEGMERIFRAQHETGKRIYEFISNVAAKHHGSPLLFRHCRILEIGCSSGGILGYFRDQGHEIVGLDFDEQYLRFGQTQHGLNLKAGGLESLPAQHQFDVIIMSHTFEHLPQPLVVLENIKKVLAPNGVVFICVPGVKRMAYYQNPPFDFLHYLQNAHVFTYSLRTLENVFRQGGFTLLQGTEEVFALFYKAQNSSCDGKTYQSDYAECLDFLKGVERQRSQRILTYRLTWPFKKVAGKVNRLIKGK